MSDHFEKVKTEILKRAAENGGPTSRDLLEALEATNEDNDEAHVHIVATQDNDHRDTLDLFDKHFAESNLRDQRLLDHDHILRDLKVNADKNGSGGLQPSQLRSIAAETARDLVRTAATVAVETVHTAEVVAKDLADTPEEGDMKRAFRVIKWVCAGAGLVLINQLGNHFFGN